MIEFTLNGQITNFDGDPDLPLMTFLREDRGIISPKTDAPRKPHVAAVWCRSMTRRCFPA